MSDAVISTDRGEVWDMMDDLGTPFLISQGRMGPHARPMSAIFRRDEGVVWFLTSATHENEEELERDPHASLAFGNGSTRYLTLVGTVSISADRNIIDDLWSPAAEAWFPNGKNDPNTRALRFQPLEAELWDGPSKPVAMLKMAGALLGGGSAHDKDDHKIVNMS